MQYKHKELIGVFHLKGDNYIFIYNLNKYNIVILNFGEKISELEITFFGYITKMI